MGEKQKEVGRVPDGTGLSSPTEPASSLGPPGFDPSRGKKIKGFTEQQTHVLLWCGTLWRRVRRESDISLNALKSAALRPYVEFTTRTSPHGFRTKVRLTPEGIELLARLGISDPPYFRGARDSGSDPEGGDANAAPGEASQSGPEGASPK